MSFAEVVLQCQSVIYYDRSDENIFFDWLCSIKSVKKYYGRGRVLFLEFDSNQIADQDLCELVGLFYRYKIEMKQLKVFLTLNNRAWFFDDKNAFWRRRIFGCRIKNHGEMI